MEDVMCEKEKVCNLSFKTGEKRYLQHTLSTNTTVVLAYHKVSFCRSDACAV